MAVRRIDIALAEVTMLVEDRTRWEAAPLIGAGEQWLRPWTIERIFFQEVARDEDAPAIRSTIQPMGILDALAVLDQHAAFIGRRAEGLRALKQTDAAAELEAESALGGDNAWKKAKGQFADLAMARVKLERPPVPPWVDGMGGDGWTEAAVDDRWGASDDALDELGPFALDSRLNEIEAAQTAVEARLKWLQHYGYPIPTGGDNTGLQAIAYNAGAALKRVHGAATKALGRARLPDTWTVDTITRRLAERISNERPALFSDMMQRGVRVIDPADPEDES